MRNFLRSIAFAALLGIAPALLGQLGSDPDLPPYPAGFPAGAYVNDEVLVKFKSTIPPQSMQMSVAAQGHTMRAVLEPGLAQVKLGAGESVAQALAVYQSNPNVEQAQPNFIYHATAIPNDTQYGQLWALKNTGQTITTGTFSPTTGTAGDDIDIEKAWDHITDCSSVVVAVVDSGVNYNQQDLAGNMWNGGMTFPNHGWNYVNGNNDPMDLNGHGTHVAGTIGAVGNNALGVTGVCWTASIMAVRVLDAEGSGTTANIVLGINFAVTQGAKVINMSLGGGGFDQLFSDAITTAQNSDVVVVVAAGNDGLNNDTVAPTYPCNFTQPNLICVAALNQNYALASFSNYGATSVDVGAPGTNVLSSWAGTSATVTDPLTGGWTTSTTTSGGWALGSTALRSGASTQSLLNPANYPAGQYNNSTDDRAYKAFNLAGVNGAALQFFTAIDVTSGDYARVAYKSAGGDPFSGGSTVFDQTNLTGSGSLGFDITNCISATCSVGFQLQTDASNRNKGVAVGYFSIDTLTLNATTYNTINGTSMATPEVAGLATMLRAFNPSFRYADVVGSIKNGGRPLTSLNGKTTSGNAIDVMRSLAYINAPTGLSATVQ